MNEQSLHTKNIIITVLGVLLVISTGLGVYMT